MALRWKKNDPARGLARVMAGPRGSTLRDGDDKFASVDALRRDYRTVGWYWVARNDEFGVPHKNTCNEPVADEATAKADAMAYVKKHRKQSVATTKEQGNG